MKLVSWVFRGVEVSVLIVGIACEKRDLMHPVARLSFFPSLSSNMIR